MFLKVEKLEIVRMKRNVLKEKAVFQIGIFTKCRGAKYAGGSWPSCLNYPLIDPINVHHWPIHRII